LCLPYPNPRKEDNFTRIGQGEKTLALSARAMAKKESTPKSAKGGKNLCWASTPSELGKKGGEFGKKKLMQKKKK